MINPKVITCRHLHLLTGPPHHSLLRACLRFCSTTIDSNRLFLCQSSLALMARDGPPNSHILSYQKFSCFTQVIQNFFQHIVITYLLKLMYLGFLDLRQGKSFLTPKPSAVTVTATRVHFSDIESRQIQSRLPLRPMQEFSIRTGSIPRSSLHLLGS